MSDYFVYIKSHAEMPDYEETFSEEELISRKCRIRYADDVDPETGEVSFTRCGGELASLDNGDLSCHSCGETYMKQ